MAYTRQRAGGISLDPSGLPSFRAPRSLSPTDMMERIVPGSPERSRTPSPYTLERMDGHERWLDEQRRKINNGYNASALDLKSHYASKLGDTFDHYGERQRSVAQERQERIDAIRARFSRGVAEATEGEFHAAARRAVEKLEVAHALPGAGKKATRTMAQKRWSMVKAARLLGTLDQEQQPEDFAAAVERVENKHWKKMRVGRLASASLQGSTDDAASKRLVAEGGARRKLRQRKLASGGAFAERTGASDVEWTWQQLRLLYLIELVSRGDGADSGGADDGHSYARRTPVCVWIYEAISAGVLSYPFYPTSEIIGGRRTGINVSAEAIDDIDRLCAEAMMNSFRRISRTYSATTAYRVTQFGRDYLRDAMTDKDRYAVHQLLQASGVVEPKTPPAVDEMYSLVWDAADQAFSLTHPPTGRRIRSSATTVEEVSYVSSPHLPPCLRDPSRTGGAIETADNRDRVKELRVTKKSTAFRLEADDAGDDSLTLRGVHVLVCEWLPFSSNQLSMLNDKLGAGDTVQGGFFSDRVDAAPLDTLYRGAAEGLTAAYLLDFDETSYVNYEAEVFFPTENGVVQIEHIGVHFDDTGLSTYGLRLDAVEARVGDTMNPALVARLLVDIRADSSLLTNSVLEMRQRNMLTLLHGGDENERGKYNVVMSESIKPVVEAEQYIDGKMWQCELQQLLGELGSAHELEARESAGSAGLVLVFGRRGVLLAGKACLQYEPCLLAFGALRARSIVLQDMTRRLQLLNDDVIQLRAEIAVAHLDPARLHRAQERLRGLSEKRGTLAELHAVMQASMKHFKAPDAPTASKDMAGAVLHKVLNYEAHRAKLAERIEDTHKKLDTAKTTLRGLRATVTDATNARMLRSRRETLRNTEACAVMARPVLDEKLVAICVLFAGLLAIHIVDAAIYNDSKAFGAVSVVLTSVVEALRSMCSSGVCSGVEAYTAPMTLVLFALPYAFCWLFLSYVILKVARGRQDLQRPFTVERLRIDRSVNKEAFALLLEQKNVIATEVEDDRGRRVATHRWRERAHPKWSGMPPIVSLTVDMTHGFLRSLTVEHSPVRSALSKERVRELILVELWDSKLALFPRGRDDVDDWHRFSKLDTFISELGDSDKGAKPAGRGCMRACSDPAAVCGRLWQRIF